MKTDEGGKNFIKPIPNEPGVIWMLQPRRQLWTRETGSEAPAIKRYSKLRNHLASIEDVKLMLTTAKRNQNFETIRSSELVNLENERRVTKNSSKLQN